MRVLVTWGSERGGTEGLAIMLADALRRDGLDVHALPAPELRTVRGFDAVIVGGAVYANRWHRDARRFVRRHSSELRHVPVWFFSSGPLDDTADRNNLAPTRQVATLMSLVGARGHHTFGGRLARDAKGTMARAMAKTIGGDWRNPASVRTWADQLAAELPSARPGVAVEPAPRALTRLLAYVMSAAVLAAVARIALAPLVTSGLAIAVHAVATTVIVTLLARRYFLPPGARDPLPVGLRFAGGVAFLDAVAVVLIAHGLASTEAVAAVVISTGAALLATWTTGGLMSTMPWPRGPATGAHT